MGRGASGYLLVLLFSNTNTTVPVCRASNLNVRGKWIFCVLQSQRNLRGSYEPRLCLYYPMVDRLSISPASCHGSFCGYPHAANRTRAGPENLHIRCRNLHRRAQCKGRSCSLPTGCYFPPQQMSAASPRRRETIRWLNSVGTAIP